MRQVSLLARRKNRGLRERIEEITQQRDHLASLLGEADATILELYDRIADLERQLPASNVLPLNPRGHKNFETESSQYSKETQPCPTSPA
ncbi:hypothetical protein AAAC07_10875 [Pseudomonas aeruginosa]